MAAFFNRMTGLIDGTGAPRERAARRAISAAIVLSLLVHALALWRIPSLKMPSTEFAEQQSGPLTVRIVPPPSPPTPPSRPPVIRESPVPPQPPRPRVAQPPPEPAPPVRRPEAPAPRPPVLARPEPAAPAAPPAQPAPAGDFAAYVEARRRARGEPAPPPAPALEAPRPSAPPEDPNARANRLAAANLGLDEKPTFGPDPRKSGGIFQITRMSYDYAEFVFFGWNRNIRRNTSQTIEVRKGANPDIRIAVVRRMITIIREYEQADFVWESIRLGRNVTLSARQRDNAGLEDFLMLEFFEPGRAGAAGR